MEDHIRVNRTEYRIIKLLGHGKGGSSYLAERGSQFLFLILPQNATKGKGNFFHFSSFLLFRPNV